MNSFAIGPMGGRERSTGDETRRKEQDMGKWFICALLVAVAVTSGCATGNELIKMSSISTRGDVFQVRSDGGPVADGYSELSLTSSLKTHKPGLYSAKDVHGTADYKLLLNIDGQVTEIRGALREENIEPRGLRDPEAGEGIRYIFRETVRLKSGTHRIVVVVPGDNIAIEREITLSAGINNLVLEPIYGAVAAKRQPGFYGVTSFNEGIRGFTALFNGRPI
jgi:hypothetical protein